MTSLQSDPGPLPVLAIVACGFAFAVCMFQLLRLGAARRLAAGVVPAEAVQAHLTSLAR